MKKIILTLGLILSFISAPILASAATMPGVDAVEVTDATEDTIIIIVFEDAIIIIVTR